jgi:hypothetical protein
MRLQVRFEVDVPDDMPVDAAEEWVAFEVHDRNDITPRHPQMNRAIDRNRVDNPARYRWGN